MTVTNQGSNHQPHRFGGAWTDQKLSVLENYLVSYGTALSKQPFKRAYIDAFAGTGYRENAASRGIGVDPEIPDLLGDEPQALRDGSARIALRVNPGFEKYIFIEHSAARCEELSALRAEFPDKAADIDVRNADANVEIRSLCEKNWTGRRAVLFLDPYGMQVEWATIEAVAATQAIDLWVLFPLGAALNRMLSRSGDIPPQWRARIDQFLGTEAWYDKFYRTVETSDLFGDMRTHRAKGEMADFGRYFVKRLESVFPGVSQQPGVLKNSVNCPLYLLCFAVGNPRAVKPALNIANHLLKGIR